MAPFWVARKRERAQATGYVYKHWAGGRIEQVGEGMNNPDSPEDVRVEELLDGVRRCAQYRRLPRC